jgi:large subunit ribosomal protein L19
MATNLLRKFNEKMATSEKSGMFLNLRPGALVKVHQRIKEGVKTRVQIFEGLIIARKHGSGVNATITVRKVANGIGVERVFPLHLPTIEKFEIVKASKVRQSKLYYLRTKSARETRKKVKIIEPKTKSRTTSQEEEK